LDKSRPRIKRIIEIGVAVVDLKKTGDQLVGILGARGGPVISGQEFDMRAQMFRVGNIEFELMEPVSQNSLIAKFIKTRGEGLHHIALQVDDIEEAIEWMTRNDVRLINETPVAIEGFKAAFVHPASFGGVLFELIEGNPMWVDQTSLPEELQKTKAGEGIRAEGLLEVGIYLQDPKVSEEFYSKIFESGTMARGLSLGAKEYRVGNAKLRLTESTNESEHLSALTGRKPLGLSYIRLKVANLNSAISELGLKEISFREVPRSEFCDSKSLIVQPIELSSIPIFLTEKSG
jgi:methylmalonyl-CoA/ethylmalonyl-CoA epimerase